MMMTPVCQANVGGGITGDLHFNLLDICWI
jgi:hypothetical protein